MGVNNSVQDKPPSQPEKRQSLKERIKLIEIQMGRHGTFVTDLIRQSEASGEDVMAGIVMCRSAKILQKYGCLHTAQPVSDRWKV